MTDAEVDALTVSCNLAFPGYRVHTSALPEEHSGTMDLDFTDAHHGIAIGGGGLIAHTTDGGESWQRVAEGLTDAVLSNLARVAATTVVFATGSSEGTAAGGAVERSPALLLRSGDAGASWTKIYLDSFTTAADLRFATEQEGLALLYERVDGFDYQPGLYQTGDGGANWREIAYPQEIQATDFRQLEGRLAIFGSRGIALQDGPLGSWELRSFPDDSGTQLLFDGVATGVLTQINNSPSTSPRPVKFYRTTDGGRSWTLGDDGVSGPLDLAYLSSDGTGFIIQPRFEVSGDIAFQIGHLYYITTDGGLT